VLCVKACACVRYASRKRPPLHRHGRGGGHRFSANEENSRSSPLIVLMTRLSRHRRHSLLCPPFSPFVFLSDPRLLSVSLSSQEVGGTLIYPVMCRDRKKEIRL